MEVLKSRLFTYKSYAKLNLFIEVVGINEKKYHLLNSYFTFIDLFDLITFEERQFSEATNNEILLYVNGKKIGNEEAENNLILKAIRKLESITSRTFSLRIDLEKNIPIGGGMGGGSSDCATTLKFLNEHYKLGFSKDKLLEIGLSLGADVPFFINGNSCFVSGVGENFEDVNNIELSRFHVLIVNPKQEVLTKDVFKLYDDNEEKHSNFIKYFDTDFHKHGDLLGFIKSRNNDLQKFTVEMVPEIDDIVNVLNNANGCYFGRMSGSGSTCFGIFDKKENAEICMNKILEKNPHYFTLITKLLKSVDL
jgi:4-diphosphocytidyl-2-C-methyl-D-erythritol kinase